MNDHYADDQLPSEEPDDDAKEIDAIAIHLNNVRMVQVRIADAIIACSAMPVPEGESALLHMEVLVALANVYLGTATDWLTRSPKEEFAFARDRILGLVGNMSVVVNAVVDPNDTTKQRIN